MTFATIIGVSDDLSSGYLDTPEEEIVRSYRLGDVTYFLDGAMFESFVAYAQENGLGIREAIERNGRGEIPLEEQILAYRLVTPYRERGTCTVATTKKPAVLLDLFNIWEEQQEVDSVKEEIFRNGGVLDE